MFCSARERYAINMFATDRRHHAKMRRRLLDLIEEYPEKLQAWLHTHPQHELRDLALSLKRRVAR